MRMGAMSTKKMNSNRQASKEQPKSMALKRNTQRKGSEDDELDPVSNPEQDDNDPNDPSTDDNAPDGGADDDDEGEGGGDDYETLDPKTLAAKLRQAEANQERLRNEKKAATKGQNTASQERDKYKRLFEQVSAAVGVPSGKDGDGSGPSAEDIVAQLSDANTQLAQANAKVLGLQKLEAVREYLIEKYPRVKLGNARYIATDMELEEADKTSPNQYDRDALESAAQKAVKEFIRNNPAANEAAPDGQRGNGNGTRTGGEGAPHRGQQPAAASADADRAANFAKKFPNTAAAMGLTRRALR